MCRQWTCVQKFFFFFFFHAHQIIQILSAKAGWLAGDALLDRLLVERRPQSSEEQPPLAGCGVIVSLAIPTTISSSSISITTARQPQPSPSGQCVSLFAAGQTLPHRRCADLVVRRDLLLRPFKLTRSRLVSD